MPFRNFLFRTGLAPVLLFLGGCASMAGPEGRLDLARSVAAPARMIQSTLPAAPFALTVFSRVDAPGGPATVYIEGDGLAWLDRRTPSPDPTPTDPVALRLAALDGAPNVIWIARPCQYTKMLEDAACPQKYWMSARLAPEVIDSLNAALNDLKARHGFSGYNLVGFSGGGGAAALLAARRPDTLTLRTVAGNLNHALFAQIHGISPMTDSLDPIDAAPATASIPQIHFVGKDDKVVPPEIAQSFAGEAIQHRCANIRTEKASHDENWPQLWGKLKSITAGCE